MFHLNKAKFIDILFVPHWLPLTQVVQIQKNLFSFILSSLFEIELKLTTDQDGTNRDHAPLFFIQTFTLENFRTPFDEAVEEIYRLNNTNEFKLNFKVQVFIDFNYWQSLLFLSLKLWFLNVIIIYYTELLMAKAGNFLQRTWIDKKIYFSPTK
jgi:hypothetical protein